MRILVFVKTFANPTLTFIYSEILEMSKKHEVLVITNERRNEELFPFQNVKEVPFSTENIFSKIKLKLQYNNVPWSFKNSNFEKSISEMVENFKPDIIHTHFGFESWYFLYNFKNRLQIPIFISFHGFDASHKLNSWLYRQSVRKFFKRNDINPIFVSNFMKKHVADKLGLKTIKGKILYYGTDTEFFKPDTDRNIKNEEIIFLQISSFTEKKGHEYTIKAFHKYLQLGSKNSIKAKMILAGDGSLRQSAIDLVEQLKISDKVSFPGIVTKFGARELMMEANIFVHHSITSLTVGDMEGIPNAIMEAMAMELPILSTFHSGIPELVENNLNGYLVEERDIEDYSNKMDLISNWSKLPINREKVEMFFEKNTHQKSLENYYLEALNI